mmetsp:Transcript_51824/g.137044  ORF Transcript_51824/g.137044 Transcript_51824/m.137044 type:complete len:412 (+) Transcript_51824:63-1298(+)
MDLLHNSHLDIGIVLVAEIHSLSWIVPNSPNQRGQQVSFVGVHSGLHSLILGLVPLPALVNQHRRDSLPLQRVQREFPHRIETGEGAGCHILLGVIGHLLGLVPGVVDPVPEASKWNPQRQEQQPAEKQRHLRPQIHEPLGKRRFPNVPPEEQQEHDSLDGDDALLTQRSDREMADIQRSVMQGIPKPSSENNEKSQRIRGVLPVQSHADFADVVQNLTLGILGCDDLVTEIPCREHPFQQRQVHGSLCLSDSPHPLLIFQLGAELRCHLASLVNLFVRVHELLLPLPDSRSTRTKLGLPGPQPLHGHRDLLLWSKAGVAWLAYCSIDLPQSRAGHVHQGDTAEHTPDPANVCPEHTHRKQAQHRLQDVRPIQRPPQPGAHPLQPGSTVQGVAVVLEQLPGGDQVVEGEVG